VSLSWFNRSITSLAVTSIGGRLWILDEGDVGMRKRGGSVHD
jgi:hypothetical protein